MVIWDTIVEAALGKFAPSIVGHYTKKMELKNEIEMEVLRGKAAYELAKSNRAAQSEGRDHEWEMESLANSGFKDEWVMALVSIPAIGAFIPKFQPYIVEGFAALEATPVWYQIIMSSVFLAAYGIRWWRRKV